MRKGNKIKKYKIIHFFQVYLELTLFHVTYKNKTRPRNGYYSKTEDLIVIRTNKERFW